MCCRHRPVAGQRQADGFVEAVHGVGGEHARTTAAGGTGGAFEAFYLLVAYGIVCRFYHHVYQVEVTPVQLACFHGASRHEHRRYVQPHGSHEHAGRNLVAVADANHGVRLMGVYHIFYAVGYNIARGQGIEHSVMPHRNSVVNGYRVELGGKAAGFLNLCLHQLPDFMQMHMPRHELCKRIDYRYHRLSKLLFLHPVGTPQGTRSCHPPSFGTEGTA
ncbi:hypothetical protein Barb4_01329 [Bacteroidales bacterium Barb4]|nr:hypothetical protein Barb4_01329 [Bacteroidales bacterium Barb4]